MKIQIDKLHHFVYSGWIFLALIVMSGVAFSAPLKSSGYLYGEVSKGVNDGYIWGLPVLEWNILQKPLLIDLEFRNNFTSPRGSLRIPNHHSSQFEVHLGQVWGAYWATFSFGGIYYYGGNDDGIAEGLGFRNTLRGGIKF